MNTRRQFLANSAQTAALMGIGVLSAQAESGYSAVQKIQTNSKQARSIAIGNKDEILLAADRKVVVFNPNGTMQRETDLKRAPRCLAMNSAGQTWVGLKNQLILLDSTGKIIREGAVLDRSSVLSSLVLSPQGDIWTADSGQHVIWRLNAEGQVVQKIKRPGADFKSPKAFFPLAWSGDHLVVANPGRHSVETYAASGERQTSWGEHSRHLEGFSGCCNPVSLTTLKNGHIITAERGQPRIKTLRCQGSFFRAVGRTRRPWAGILKFHTQRNVEHL